MTEKELIQEAVPKDLKEYANELCHRFILVDGHIDVPYRLEHQPEDISLETKKGHFDYVRAKKGGLDAPFMSIYVPARYENNGAKKYALELIEMVKDLANKYPDKFALAISPQEIKSNFDKGLISLPMGIENGAPIEGDLNNLDLFYEKGIRYITLCHSKDNHICDSSYDTRKTWKGLSPFGHELIKKMNRTGMMIDVSHVSDDAFYQIMEISQAPVIASHSSCRHFTPGFERNLSDEMITMIGQNGGIVMVNFGSSFLSSKANTAWEGVYQKMSQGISAEDPQLKAEIDAIIDSEEINGTATLLADHIDHVVQLIGIDHVGLGSDFDGLIGLPVDMKDVSQYPNLIHELLKRGYSEEDIEKICSKNIFRIWGEITKKASEY